jgi:antitoxin HicB
MKTITKPKTLEDYLALVYPITLYPEPEGGYTVMIKDLPGCISVGETLEEAVENIKDAKESWLETAWEFKDHIPLPSDY